MTFRKYYIIVFLSCCKIASAQVDYEYFERKTSATKTDTSQYYVDFFNLNFMKNNEYYNKINEGYTLYGNQIHPKLIYLPNENIKIEGGLFLLKEFGFDGFSQVLPTFTLRVDKGPLSLLFGNIDGCLSHKLIEPLYDFEKVFTNPVEYGGQIKLNTRRFIADGWMNWEKGIHFNADHLEELTLGVSTFTYLFKSDKINISIPLQAYVAHKGGQIDTVPYPVFTHFNSASGIIFAYQSSNKNAFIQKLETQNYFVYNKDWSFTKELPFTEGKGFFTNNSIGFKHGFAIVFQYWNGNKMIAPRGGPLYQSIDIVNKSYVEKARKLLLVKLIHEHKLFEFVYLSTRFEPYYDLDNHLWEYGFSVHAIFKQMIPLAVRK